MYIYASVLTLSIKIFCNLPKFKKISKVFAEKLKNPKNPPNFTQIVQNFSYFPLYCVEKQLVFY